MTSQHHYQELTTEKRPIFILRGASTQAGKFFTKLSFIVEQRKTTGLDLPLGQEEGGEKFQGGVRKHLAGKGNKMIKDDRNFHLRLQEFCDCFLETDYQKELEAVSRGGPGDPGSDEEELSLKFLGLAILYGATQEIKKFSLQKRKEGKILFSVEGKGSYQLPPPAPEIADRIFSITRSIMHLEEDQGAMPFPLGLRHDRLELRLKLERNRAEESLTVAFPQS